MEHDTQVAHPAADSAVAAALDTAADTGAEIEERLIDDELLVEEISIDGMCGVY